MVQSGSVTRNMLPVQQALGAAHLHHLRSRPLHPNLTLSHHFANTYWRETSRSAVTRESGVPAARAMPILPGSLPQGTVRDVRYYGSIRADVATRSGPVPARPAQRK